MTDPESEQGRPEHSGAEHSRPEHSPGEHIRPEHRAAEHRAREEAADALGEAARQIRSRRRALAGLGVGSVLAGVAGGFVRGRVRGALGGRRRRRRLLRRFGFGLIIVVLSVTTCSFGVDPSTLTASWGDPVPATTEDAARVMTRGAEAVRSAAGSGAVRLVLTEAEATSALSLGMMLPDLMWASERIPREEILEARDLEALRERIREEADARREELAEELGFLQRMLVKADPRIRTGDVQVRFEETGEVVLAGYVQAWRFRQPGLLVLAPRASGGELELDFVSGRLGRVPLPELVFDWLGRGIASAILLGREHAEVSELSVGDGTLTFVGRLPAGG